MSYKVTHSERYTLTSPPKTYETIADIKDRYVGDSLFYNKLIDSEIGSMKVGESNHFMYDFYINLTVERLE